VNAFLIGIALLISAGVFLVLWWVPKKQVASLRNKRVNAQDVFKSENDARATLAQIIGGLAVLIGLYFAWQNLKQNISTTTQNLELTNKNLELTKEGQVTERFTKAIEELGATDDKGNPKLALRLGGIYALERIAVDSERDYWPIMEVLTAYVREKEANSPALPLATDIQAILTVIRRRQWSYEKSDQRLDLHRTDLHGADLREAHLESANLSGADLTGANLTGANLTYADLESREESFSRTELRAANLMGAFLAAANLSDADLYKAVLRNAVLLGANLNGANLIDANLTGANLWSANLHHVWGAGADLKDADVRGANLEGLFSDQKQFNSANGDKTTKLPPGFIMPESWKKQELYGQIRGKTRDLDEMPEFCKDKKMISG
jgi:hypothetical protein